MHRALVIGHRGASGYRPEHTLESYRLAAELGADCIEPDLVSTKDHVLVARHENEISTTTDAADGTLVSGLSLAELRRLRARERIPELRPQNTEYDGRFSIPTFREVLELRERLAGELGREIWVYPETKHPSWFRSLGLPLEEPLVRELTDFGLDRPDSPVFIQSFEANSLRRLRAMIGVPLVQLLAAPADLTEIATYAEGVGPAKALATASFIAEAHAAGLAVHPYTFRIENAFLPAQWRSSSDPAEPGDLAGELRAYLADGIDGFFTDNPDIGARACGRPC